ncbi:hypothetical protein [Tenacibaculum sp. IB213877]|uniref:hypothetical protein n=1 Tax=Tenacibaculum sp. IB213877 TaxID=3097351 RepID=UPI002A5B0422|nr:hypothetical protein [Tenacibaculum sp. IB213877]MDY0780409.1 hypothetical protein [Tenacibaculum sp. IB213877]
MSLKAHKSTLTFLFFSFLGLVIAILGVFFLPERFFFDTPTILFDRYNEIGWRGSYPFAIMFYHLTGLKHLSFSIIGLIQFSIAIYLIFKIGIPKNFHKTTAKNLISYLSFILIGIFLCMPTKEFINIVYIATIVLLFKKNKHNLSRTVITTLLLLIFFGYFFREYYLLIAFLSVVFYLISKTNIKNKNIATIFYGLLVAISVSLSYGVVKGEFISQKTRESYNESRKNGVANNSAITSPIKTDSWYGESFGIVYGFFSINLPINGFKHILSPQIIAFVFWQLLLFIILFIRYERCFKEGIIDNSEIWIFYILFSFFIVQGVFEPDLGSAIRHKMGIFPIIYYALYYDTFKKKNEL